MIAPRRGRVARLRRIVRRRQGAFFLFFALVVGVVGAGTLLSRPVYRAEALLLVEGAPGAAGLPGGPQAGRPGGPGAAAVLMPAEILQRHARGILGTLTARPTLRRLVAEGDLASWPEFRGLPAAEAIERLRGRIRVDAAREDDLVRVSLEGRDPQRIAAGLNRLVDLFLACLEPDGRLAEARRDLAQRGERVRGELAQVEAAIRDLAAGGGRVVLQEELRRCNLEMRGAHEAAARARETLDVLEEKGALASESLEAGEPGAVRLAILGDEAASEEVGRLRGAADRLSLEELALAARGGYLRADREGLQRRLAATLDLVARREKEAGLRFQRRLAEARAVHAARSRRLAQATEKARLARDRLDRLEGLRERRDALVREESMLRSDRMELVAEEARGGPSVRARVIDTAVPPARPVGPRPMRSLLAAAVAGILGGLVLVLAAERLDDRIKGRRDVRRALALPSLGFIPELEPADGSDSEGAADLVTLVNPSSPVSERFLGLCTGILGGEGARNEDGGGRGEVVAVTSASPGEGKTTAAVNLAVAMARGGYRTLLVDGNLRAPRVHRVFGMRPGGGIGEVLRNGGGDPCAAIRKTSIEGLEVLPAGSAVASPAELFLGGRLARVLAALRGRYDRLVLDAPSILEASEAVVAGKLADRTLMVVGAYRTSGEQARAGKEYLEGLGVPVAGVILNRLRGSDLEPVAPRPGLEPAPVPQGES